MVKTLRGLAGTLVSAQIRSPAPAGRRIDSIRPILVVTAEPVTRPDDDSRPIVDAFYTVLQSKLGRAIVSIVNYNVESTMTS